MRRLDVAIGAVLFVAALALGTWYVPQVVAAGGRPHFYQDQFGAAVMFACGHGYVNPADPPLDELREFLSLQRDEIACSDRLAAANRSTLTPMQRAYRYLMTTVGWTWRLQGRVAWSGLSPLYGLFFASTIVLLFALFRQGMGRTLSAVLAMVLAVSPLHITYLAHLRDYSKAPFVVALVLLAARMVVGPMPLARAVRLALIAGVVTGVGMGFRNDLMVAVPAVFAVLLLFLPHDQFPRGWRNLVAPAAYGLSFALTLSPMWSIYRVGGGSSSQHLVVLGLGETFSSELGLDNGGLYELSYGYKDEFAQALISGHASRRLGQAGLLPMYGGDYDRAAGNYLREVARLFPADLLSRSYASVLGVLELPYNAQLIPPHSQFLHIPRPILAARGRFQWAMAPFWTEIVALALIGLTLSSVRIGLLATGLVFYLSAYPAIQFAERHYFHLEFISWWALGFVVTHAGQCGYSLVRGEGRTWLAGVMPVRGWRRALWSTAALTLALAVLLIAPLALLRDRQQQQLTRVFQDYASAPIEAPPLTAAVSREGWTGFAIPPLPGATEQALVQGALVPELFVAEFGGPACDSLKLDAVFRYVAASPPFDFTRPIQVQPPLSATPLRIFFPAYFHHTNQAQGGVDTAYRLSALEVPASAAGCVTRLGRVTDTSHLPLLFELRLAPGWEHADFYQTKASLESRTNGDELPVVYTSPPDLEVGRQVLMGAIEPLRAADILKRSPTLDTSAATWRNTGVGGVGGKGPYLYLFEMGPRPAQAGEIALIQGRVNRGGISFGLVRDGVWVEQAGVTARGEFTVVVRVPADGAYSLVLANNMPSSSLESDVLIHRAGWVGQTK